MSATTEQSGAAAIRALLGLPITIFGTGKQLRDILFASDAAAAFGDFYRSGAAGIYNTGGGVDNRISLLESIALIEELTGKKANVQFQEGRFGDLHYFVTDHSRLSASTGWRPKIRPRHGVNCLIEWVKRNPVLFVANRFAAKET